MSELLWPPTDYPVITAPTPTVTGCTRNSTVNGLSTFTAQNPAVAATTTRTVRPIFVNGQGGVLRWSVTVAALAAVTLTVQAQVTFTDDDDAQVGRWTGPQWTGITGIVLSASQPVPRLATQALLKVLSTSDTNSGQWTEIDSRLEQLPDDDPYLPPPVDPEFGLMSPEGVMPPPPPAGLPGGEANSPARRSPQVRWCQAHDSIRPDLTAKRNAREV
jgi:hypothetical protein